MSLPFHLPARRLAIALLSAALAFGAVGTPVMQANILRKATNAQDPLCGDQTKAPGAEGSGTNADGGCTGNGGIFGVVDNLMTPALWIVVALAPLVMAWGGGMLMFGGKHGPQLMAGAIVAIVLVASTKGLAG